MSESPSSPRSLAQVLGADGMTSSQHLETNRKRKLDLVPSCSPRKKVFAGFRHFHATIPRSAFDDLSLEKASWCEADALKLLPTISHQQYRVVNITDFTIYRSPHATIRPNEMVSLHALKVEIGVDTLCFDGSLCIDGREMHLQGIEFSTLAIHGYASTHITSVVPSMCIQSDIGSYHNVWYRLTRPSTEYSRYHDAFLWIADLAKYTIDFMLSRDAVGLNHFRHAFRDWLEESYSNAKCVRSWLSKYGSNRDFRSAIAANIHYLWKEAYDVDGTTDRHPLWAETDQNRLNAIPQHKRSEDSTIVTPFIHNMFNKMSFNGFLKVQDRYPSLRSTTVQRRELLGLIPPSTICVNWTAPAPQAVRLVQPEDVVYVRPDRRSEWSSAEETWLALVQKVRTLKSGRTKLDLLWLYRPSDTSIGQSFYPFQNELFLSDNCSCDRDSYDLQDVLGRADVLWGNQDLATAAQQHAYVVRQTYMTDSHEFATFRQEHLSCRCKDNIVHPFAEAVADYQLGSFILYRTGNLESDTGRDVDSILEPAQVVSFLYTSHKLRLRVLRRARTKQPAAPPNELLWTEEYVETPAYNHVRLCVVQGFSNVNDVTEVFGRGGAGDLFYYVYHAEDPNPFPSQTSPSLRPLRGLGICCGGGSFDRGLEDGGAVRFEHAIDFDSLALHTYRANADPNDPPNLFLGPMEKYLEDSLQAGTTTYPRANVGEVELIAAGSPCQSFSILQPNKESSRSLKHASLIACVLSYVEHYMPYYFYLENVVAISSVAKGVSEDQSMMRKIIATLVALGYQLQQHVLDAPSYGSFQSRRRVIVTASAPGLTPPARPPQSHLSRPDGEQFRVTHLGSLANGKRFGASQDELAPFETVTFHEGTKDLPDIGDGHTYTCIPFPDHRQGGARLSHEQRRLIPLIPQYPRGMGLAKAHELGKIPEPQVQRWLGNKTRSATNTKSFSRVQPDTIITTITTGLHTIDAFVGTCIHPNQNRLLTVMEARRAQGFPDHEVILGGRQRQWKIIGNSVHRNVAFALGLSLREAWQKSCQEESQLVQHLEQGSRVTTRLNGTCRYELASEAAMGIARDIEKDRRAGSSIAPIERFETRLPGPFGGPRSNPRRQAPDLTDTPTADGLSRHRIPRSQHRSQQFSRVSTTTTAGHEIPVQQRPALPGSSSIGPLPSVPRRIANATSRMRSATPVLGETRSETHSIPIRDRLSPSVTSGTPATFPLSARGAAPRSPTLQLDRPELSHASAEAVPPAPEPSQALTSLAQPIVAPPNSSQSTVQSAEEEQTVTETTTTTVVTTTTTTVKKVIKIVRRGSADATEEVTTMVTTN